MILNNATSVVVAQAATTKTEDTRAKKKNQPLSGCSIA
jgi:hypothetical protein